MFNIGVQYALRNIFRTPLRSFFTFLSVAMIMSLYVIVTGVGDSFTRQITTLLGQHNIDVIVQSKYAVSPLSSRIPKAMLGDIIHRDLVQDYGVLTIGKLTINDHAEGFVIGVDAIDKFSQELGLSIVEGRASSGQDHEIMMARQLASVLKIHSGDVLTLSGSGSYRVVGLYETWIGFFNSSLICTMSDAQALLHREAYVSMLVLALKKPYASPSFIESVNQKYPELKAIRSSDFSNKSGSLKALFTILHIISLVTLAIASAIVLNTFVMAINERSKEIAILLAIGWSKTMVTMVLMFESVILSLFGGLAGFFVSFPVLSLLKAHYQNISVYMPTSLGAGQLTEVVVLCITIGIVSIVFPAIYGVRKNIARGLHGK